MKAKIYRLAILISSISTLSFSCNKNNLKVELKSNTLKLTNYTCKFDQDFKSNFELIHPFYHTFPVTLDNKIQVGSNYLKDNEYTYNLETGEILIPKKYVTDDIVITVEATNNSDTGYEAQFSIDSHVKIFIYKTEDYTTEPYISDRAYSRDKLTGELTKDGKGEINVKVIPDDGYDIDMFWVKGLHDKLIDRSDTNQDIYTITNIRSNLAINITSKKIYCKKFASKDNASDRSIDFSWNYRNPTDVMKTTIKVTHNNITDNFETANLSFTLRNLSYDTKYDFSFIPTLNDGSIGSEFTCTRFLLNPDTKLNIPYFEINTENNIWPQRKIYAPKRRSSTAVCKENVLTDIKFSNSDGSSIYASPSSFADKIKIRGNFSSVAYTKQPYKLKLKNAVDLLKDFRDTSLVDYTHKEWVLLPAANEREPEKEGTQIFNTGVANALCKMLDFDYKPMYKFVCVYLNGDYQGLYILAEQVARGNGQNDNQGRYKIDKDGFIIESDLFEWAEDISFRGNLIRTKCAYTFKYPDTENFNEDSDCYKYIKDYVLKFEEQLQKQSIDCFNYFDIYSLAKWLMLHEIIKTNDAPGSNIFITKKNMKDDSKLVMGTPWDFDGCLYGSPEGECDIKSSDYFYYFKLKKIDVFKDKLKDVYKSNKDKIINCITSYFSTVDNDIFNHLLSIEIKRWNVVEEQQMSIKEQKSNIKTFLEARIEYLNSVYDI